MSVQHHYFTATAPQDGLNLGCRVLSMGRPSSSENFMAEGEKEKREGPGRLLFADFVDRLGDFA
jgi:hypothetical protein